MFDPEQAIKDWRQEMRARGIRASETLDELENHLREDVEQQIRSGCDPRLSFEAAVMQMGKTSAIKNEFQKIRITELVHQVIHAVRVLAGIPDYQLVNNMNTSRITSNV